MLIYLAEDRVQVLVLVSRSDRHDGPGPVQGVGHQGVGGRSPVQGVGHQLASGTRHAGDSQLGLGVKDSPSSDEPEVAGSLRIDSQERLVLLEGHEVDSRVRDDPGQGGRVSSPQAEQQVWQEQ